MWVLCWCRENRVFLNQFQGRNLLGDDENFKRGGEVTKGENEISRGEPCFFFFINQNFCHILFLFFSRYCTKRKIPRIKLMTILLFKYYHLYSRRILKYFNIDLNTENVFQTLILLPSLCVSTV